METQQARDTGDEVLVERDDCGERPAGRRIAQPQPMLAGRIGDDDMASVDPGQVSEKRAQRAWIDCAGGVESVRRGVENNRDGGQFRAPDDRL